MKVKIVKEVKRSDGLWRFACGDVFLFRTLPTAPCMPTMTLEQDLVSCLIEEMPSDNEPETFSVLTLDSVKYTVCRTSLCYMLCSLIRRINIASIHTPVTMWQQETTYYCSIGIAQEIPGSHGWKTQVTLFVSHYIWWNCSLDECILPVKFQLEWFWSWEVTSSQRQKKWCQCRFSCCNW